MARNTQKQREQSAKKIQMAERRRAVVGYRRLGVPFYSIGEKLDISESQARADYKAARDEIQSQTQETIEEMRALENERLDMQEAAIVTQVLKGDVVAGALRLKISERRAKLNGLDKAGMLGEGEEGIVFGVVRVPFKASSKEQWADQAQAAQKDIVVPADEDEGE